MNRNIAIITARGGSKRIPRKNIKDFCGKPIIAYPIEAALNSNLFDEVMVSTEDEEIASVARFYGANVPFMRSSKTSDDFATTEDVLIEVLTEYEKIGRGFDNLCCIYPTAPFVTVAKIQEAMQLMELKRPEQILPLVRYSFPPQRCNIINSHGFVEYKFPEYKTTRSQDLEVWYHDAGQFYIYDVKKFLACKGNCTEFLPIFLSELEVQDIDNEVDWKMAELKYKYLNQDI